MADDFTGACDVAAPFAAAGQRTEVQLEIPEAWADEVDVLTIDLDARELAAERAHVATREAAKWVGMHRPSARLFVKIDSTLRGPIEALVAGALAGSGRAVAVVSPAFPEQGRLLVGGRLQLRGEAVSEAQALDKDLEASLIGAERARSTEVLESAIEAAGARRVVVDADDGVCLASLAMAWRRHPEWLLVGSSGLARRVAGPSGGRSLAIARGSGEVLVVAGSPAEATHRQLERLPLHPMLRVLSTSAAQQRDAGQCAAALADEVARSVATRPAGLVLVGGQTARLVCRRWQAHGVRIEGELEPGVPYGRLIGGVWDSLSVVTKAGGFGGADTLLDAVHALGVSSLERT